MTRPPGNAALAEQLLAEAQPLMARRRALLCASTALGTTATIGAALQALADWDGPADIRGQASAIITSLRDASRQP